MNKIGMIAAVTALSAGLFGYQYFSARTPAPAVDVGEPVDVDAALAVAQSLVVPDVPLEPISPPATRIVVDPVQNATADAAPFRKSGGFVIASRPIDPPAKAATKRSTSSSSRQAAMRPTRTPGPAKVESPFKPKTSPLTSALNHNFHTKPRLPFSGVVKKNIQSGKRVRTFKSRRG